MIINWLINHENRLTRFIYILRIASNSPGHTVRQLMQRIRQLWEPGSLSAAWNHDQINARWQSKLFESKRFSNSPLPTIANNRSADFA
jgi:hypothetical protein